MYRLGFSSIDPPDRPVSARTLVVPTPLLTAKFDGHLIETASRLLETSLAGHPGRRRHAPAQIDAETRRKLLGAIETCDQAWVGALERVLEAMGLSVARRLEARRHLLSPSHRLLTLLALRHWYGLPPQDEGEGLLADDMAAELLRLQRQNFQTTRDHIAALLQLGLLERRAGRALRVALAEPAAAELDAGMTRPPRTSPPRHGIERRRQRARHRPARTSRIPRSILSRRPMVPRASWWWRATANRSNAWRWAATRW